MYEPQHRRIGGLATVLSLLIMLLLALTSNSYSARLLKRRWKQLHWWVYPAALLTVLHWFLGAFDPTLAYVHIAMLLALLALRAAAKLGFRIPNR